MYCVYNLYLIYYRWIGNEQNVFKNKSAQVILVRFYMYLLIQAFKTFKKFPLFTVNVI